MKVNGSTPKLNTSSSPSLILGVLAWGMWRARYWAVVCFQIVLVFLIFTAVYGLMVEATSVAEISASVGLLVVAGVLFWMMVKAMARIQMPRPRPAAAVAGPPAGDSLRDRVPGTRPVSAVL